MSSLPSDAAVPRPPDAGASPRAGGEMGLALGLCPLLRSTDASWSSLHASRDLRCWAVEPPLQPALAKQRALCVSPRHDECATYQAALAAEGRRATSGGSVSLLWSGPVTPPVALEPTGGRSLGIGPGRALSQALLVGLMVVAFAVLLISRAGPLGGGVGSPPPASSVAMASAGALASASGLLPPAGTPSASPAASATASPVGSGSAAPGPSPTPSPSPAASPRTYKVRSGDTLAVIAGKYHTTVKAIVTANNISDPRTIHPGQVLIIP